MPTYGFVVPIAPGMTEAWKKFSGEMGGPRRAEFIENRRRAGVHREQVFLQSTPMGDMIVVVLDCDDPSTVLQGMASADPFGRWFASEVKRIHGMDLTDAARTPPNPMVADTMF